MKDTAQDHLGATVRGRVQGRIALGVALENLQRALEGGGQTSETYQKPLG